MKILVTGAKGFIGFTSELLDLLKKHNNKAPVIIFAVTGTIDLTNSLMD